MSQPNVDGAELHRQIETDSGGGEPSESTSDMSLFGMSFSMTHVLVVVILVGLAAVYLGNRPEDDSGSITDAEPDEDAQDVLDDFDEFEDDDNNDISIEHDPTNPLASDSQAMDVIWGGGAS